MTKCLNNSSTTMSLVLFVAKILLHALFFQHFFNAMLYFLLLYFDLKPPFTPKTNYFAFHVAFMDSGLHSIISPNNLSPFNFLCMPIILNPHSQTSFFLFSMNDMNYHII